MILKYCENWPKMPAILGFCILFIYLFFLPSAKPFSIVFQSLQDNLIAEAILREVFGLVHLKACMLSSQGWCDWCGQNWNCLKCRYKWIQCVEFSCVLRRADPVVLVLHPSGPDVPPSPGSQVFPVFAVPSVQDTLPSSPGGDRNEFLGLPWRFSG